MIQSTLGSTLLGYNGTAPAGWYLEGALEPKGVSRRIAVNPLPFFVGRRTDMSLALNCGTVSKMHAELREERNSLVLRDLGSTNGTFVNGQRIAEIAVRPGDVLQFADCHFRVGLETPRDVTATIQQDASQWFTLVAQFGRLFDEPAAIAHFQPIVALPSGTIIGYEALGRGLIDGLRSPYEMFQVAERLGLETDLSRHLRRQGVLSSRALPGSPIIFLNTHPSEQNEPALIQSLRELRTAGFDQPIVLEIHEGAVTNPATMREIRAALRDLNMQLAYDDFGAGQARLVDLADVPPDYLKFDMNLVRRIHLAPPEKQQMLRALVRMAHDLGVAVLAEGVECIEEAHACAALGFEFAQGYYFGRPAAAESFLQ